MGRCYFRLPPIQNLKKGEKNERLKNFNGIIIISNSYLRVAFF
jgi:hypothetical protein